MIVRSRRVVLPDAVRPAAIHIENGTITRIGGYDEPAAERFEAGDLVILPGIVDTHVHVNEPGRTDWEGFETATRAAAAGGVTTIVDMPLNSIPATTTVAGLEAKRASAAGRCHVDVAFWGGVVPQNAGDLDALVANGVRGFKCFLAPSGVDDFPPVGDDDLRRALPVIARRGVPLLAHAELPEYLAPPADATYRAYLASRPPEAEVQAIRLLVRLARASDARVHIVHVACAGAVAEIAAARAAGVRITGETCPHYLTFAADEIPSGATEFKCAPPIREASHREALWAGLASGALDLIATDHSPSPPAMKCRGDFTRAWGGIASLELSLRAVWTAAHAPARGCDTGNAEQDTSRCLRRVARWMSEKPAQLAGLDARKGRIAAGYDADLCVWDPDRTHAVDAARLQQRHKLTPYAGRLLQGQVRATFVRGRRVWDGERIVGDPSGQLL